MSLKQIDGYKIRMNNCLGRGAFGSVYIGESDQTHLKVAIKIIQKNAIDSDQYLKTALFQEIKIMQSVHHTNIVSFIDVMESSKNYYIIQELCDGDISKIMQPKKQISEKESIEMLTDICNGFLALVREGIMHRDLKPANIMIKNHEKGRILKIGDFGFAKKIPKNINTKNSVVGTPLYMSLQILKNEDYTSKCDIWALGFIFYEMLHGYTPWTAKNEFQLAQNIENIPLTIGRKDLSEVTVDFIKKCLAVSQKNRISWDELFIHPIFDGFFDKKATNKRFENKLKHIMGELRFYIKKNNLDLAKILQGLGYTSENQELNFQAYYKFLTTVYPDIRKEEALYVFKETDIDHSNSISILQIENILQKHDISMCSNFQGIPRFVKKQKQEDETFSYISQNVQKKIHSCFTRLYRIITRNKMTLQKVFNDFAKQKNGKLSDTEFERMMKKLDNSLLSDEISETFNLIDEDKSKTIEFDELNKYYCKVNGIPYSIDNEPMEIESNYMLSSSSMNSSNKSNNSVKQAPNVPQNYPPSSYQMPIFSHQMPIYQQIYQPPIFNEPNQNQPQGMFGNFILNQLSQHMYGSNKNIKQGP